MQEAAQRIQKKVYLRLSEGKTYLACDPLKTMSYYASLKSDAFSKDWPFLKVDRASSTTERRACLGDTVVFSGKLSPSSAGSRDSYASEWLILELQEFHAFAWSRQLQ